MNKKRRHNALNEILKSAKISSADGLDVELLSNSERAEWISLIRPAKLSEDPLGARAAKDSGSRRKAQGAGAQLGRRYGLIEIYKEALRDTRQDVDILRSELGQADYVKIVGTIFPIFNEVNPRDFDESTYIRGIHAAMSEAGVVTTPKATMAIKNIASAYSERNKVEPPDSTLEDYLEKGHYVEFQSAISSDQERIASALEGLGLIDSGAGEEAIIQALVGFQGKEGLAPAGLGAGHVDSATLAALITGSASAGALLLSNRMDARTSADTALANAGEPLELSSIGDLKYIQLGDRADFGGATEDLIRFVEMMDGVISKLGLVGATITSVFRSPFNQARIMLINFNRIKRSEDLGGAKKYLESLYSRFPNIGEISDIFGADYGDEEKRNNAAAIISNTWSKRGHLGGMSFDVAGLSKGQFDTIFAEMPTDGVEFDRLWESKPGPHYHMTVIKMPNTVELYS